MVDTADLHQFGACTDLFGIGPVCFMGPAGRTYLEVEVLCRLDNPDKSGLAGGPGSYRTYYWQIDKEFFVWQRQIFAGSLEETVQVGR